MKLCNIQVWFLLLLITTARATLRCATMHFPHVLHGSICFVWIKNEFRTWHEANADCKALGLPGGRFAHLESYDILQAVSAMVAQASGYTFLETWKPFVGLYRHPTFTCTEGVNEQLFWADWTGFQGDDSWWAPGEPTSCSEKATVLNYDGTMKTEGTQSIEKRTFICQFDEPPDNPSACDLITNYTTTQSNKENKCIAKLPISANQIQSQEMCSAGSLGCYGTLAMPKTMQDHIEIDTFLRDEAGYSGSYHLGAQLRSYECNTETMGKGWFFEDGSLGDPPQYWDPSALFSCSFPVAYLKNDKSGMYSDYDTASAYICQFDMNINPSVCSSLPDTTVVDDICYHATIAGGMNYQGAAMRCADGSLGFQDGSLAVIKSATVLAQLLMLISSFPDKFHVGLRRYHTNACQAFANFEFQLFNGETLNQMEATWYPGYPTAGSICGNPNYLSSSADPVRHGWMHGGANMITGVCEFACPQHSSSAATVDSVRECVQTIGGVVIGGNCYWTDTTGRTWDDCQAVAMSKGGKLAHLYTRVIMRTVARLLDKTQKYFVGGKLATSTTVDWMLDSTTVGESAALRAPLRQKGTATVGHCSYLEYYGPQIWWLEHTDACTAAVLKRCLFSKPIPYNKYKMEKKDIKLVPTNSDVIASDQILMNKDERACAAECINFEGCLSFNHWPASGRCQVLLVNYETVDWQMANWVGEAGANYYQRHY